MTKITGEDIRTWREKNHVSQQQFASLAGASIGSVKFWESGKGAPSERLQASIQEVFDQYPRTNMSSPYVPPLYSVAQTGKTALASQACHEWVRDSVQASHFGRGGQDAAFERNTKPLSWLFEKTPRRLCLPFPETPEQISRVAKGQIRGGAVDRVLFDKFEQERKARELSAPKMLETILWHYFGEPDLSFELPPPLVPAQKEASDTEGEKGGDKQSE
jgi:transcriptional regulator with XRE-family HTH domain